MSTEENKANVRRVIEELWNKGDLEVVDELIAPNFTYHIPGREDIKGPEGLKQNVAILRTAFPDFYITIEDMVAEGDKVAIRFIWRGTHKGEIWGLAPTGKQVTVTGISISQGVGGKGVELWESTDSLGMLQQLGVVPPMGQSGG